MLAAGNPETLLDNMSKVLFNYLSIDSFTLFATNQDGKMVKIFSQNQPVQHQENTNKISEHTINKDTLLENSLLSSGQKVKTPSKFVGNINLPINIVDPKTNETLGLLDLEKVAYIEKNNT